jgi:AraC-like DNA-binding protein
VKGLVAFFTNTHTFYYLIGPFAFFYVRSMLRDNSQLQKIDILHFVTFVIAFIGFVPYLFSGWDYKLLIADNIQSENWDMQQFHMNFIIPHKLDQLLNVLQIYFYSISLWVLLRKYKRDSNSRIYKVPQFKLIRNWLFIFTLIITIITINFTVAMANVWIYVDKSIFLDKASGALFFASIVYVLMNMIVMIFPHIMYGLPIDVKESMFANHFQEAINNVEVKVEDEKSVNQVDEEIMLSEKKELPVLFSADYINKIESLLNDIQQKELFLNPDFKLINISEISDLPAHHFTYYFNTIINLSFTEWRNKLRIEYVIKMIKGGNESHLTIEAISAKAGFTIQSTFIRCFKSHTGQTPSDYIKSVTS